MLLILAGVVLNTVLGNDGIIAKAQLAKEKTNNAQNTETEELANLENKLEEYETSGNRASTTDIVKIEVKNPSKASQWTKVADYPEGFNKDNCIIEGYWIDDSGNHNMLPYTYSTNCVLIQFNDNGISLYSTANYLGKDVVIYLIKLI